MLIYTDIVTFIRQDAKISVWNRTRLSIHT